MNRLIAARRNRENRYRFGLGAIETTRSAGPVRTRGPIVRFRLRSPVFSACSHSLCACNLSELGQLPPKRQTFALVGSSNVWSRYAPGGASAFVHSSRGPIQSPPRQHWDYPLCRPKISPESFATGFTGSVAPGRLERRPGEIRLFYGWRKPNSASPRRCCRSPRSTVPARQ